MPIDFNLTTNDLFVRGGLVLALSLIVGLQRQRAGHRLAGVRTFPLIGLFGFFSAVVAIYANSALIIAACIASLSIYLAVGLHASLKADPQTGITTEVAAILFFVLGAFLVVGPIEVGVVAAGTATIILYLKEPLHGFVSDLAMNEFRAIMQFVLIALVILPVLPNQAYDSYGVINPKEIWLIVALITGISVASHVLQRFVGNRAGAVMGGILGGLVSSTASTFTYARVSKSVNNELLMVVAIILASMISIIRVIAEVAVVAPSVFSLIVKPLVAFLIVMIIISVVSYLRSKSESNQNTEAHGSNDPSQLKAAIVFAALYAAILFGTAVVKEQFGDQALYAVSIVSGLIDVDALTLSTARLVEKDLLPADQGWRLMLTAALSNLAFKGGVCVLIGSRRVRTHVALYFGIAILIGVAMLFIWPRVA